MLEVAGEVLDPGPGGRDGPGTRIDSENARTFPGHGGAAGEAPRRAGPGRGAHGAGPSSPPQPVPAAALACGPRRKIKS